MTEFTCKDCDKSVVEESYMVRDEIWEEADGGKGFLCIACLEGRLGRELKPRDFAPWPLSLQDGYPEVIKRINPDDDWIIVYDDLSHNRDEPVHLIFCEYTEFDDDDAVIDRGVELLCAFTSEKALEEYDVDSFGGVVWERLVFPGGGMKNRTEVARFVNYKE